jgi:cytochrome c oxidase subunit 2
MPFYSLPENISTYGADIDYVILLIYWVTGVWFVATGGVFLWLLWRFRRRDGVRAAWLPGNTARSLAWILVPGFGVLVSDLVIEVASSRAWQKVKMTSPAHDELVRITGQQFAWQFTYPGPDGKLDTKDDFDSVNELHVPKGKVIRFELTSSDVVHCFSVAELRLKQDAIPGRTIAGWFAATKVGTYTVTCSELCGISHTYMVGKLHVDTPEDYSAWIKAQQGK